MIARLPGLRLYRKLQTIADLSLYSRPKNKRQSRISRLHRIGTTPAPIVQTGDHR
jgi:hypothetical protein